MLSGGGVGRYTWWHMQRASGKALELLENVLVFEVRELFSDFRQRLLGAVLGEGYYGKEDQASTPLRDFAATHGAWAGLGNGCKRLDEWTVGWAGRLRSCD